MSTAATAHRHFLARPSSGAVVDVAITVVALAGSLAQLSHGGIGGSRLGPGELDWAGGLLVACSTVPLLAWRRAPRAVFTLTALPVVLLGALGYPIALPLGPAAALYLLAASRDEADPWTQRDTSAVITLFLGYLAASALGNGELPWSELLHAGLAWGVAWFAGERTRLRRAHITELSERALRADRDAERERRLAVAEERARIARDLHDSAGHAINVIAVRAGTARLRHDEDPERSRAALKAIEEVARRTAGEIDQIVGTLRDQGSENRDMAAPPRLASLQTLVAHHSAAGLDVTVSTAGTSRPLATAVDVAAYRILQEALTNAARHGAGAARVELAFGDAALGLTVTNPVANGSTARATGGHGLIGMRERATMLGGSLETDRPHSSFRLRARLPYEGDLACRAC